MEGRLVRVVDVDARIEEIYQNAHLTPITVMICKLEDSRTFRLYYIPIEIVYAIKNLKEGFGEVPRNARNSLFDILPYFESVIENFKSVIEKVVIDELDEDSGLYTAKLFLNLGSVKLSIPMIPSHAIYLALITDKPIYVDEKLLEREYGEVGDYED
ncbi:bifunctional nuclease family protein [Ignicoccus hospitalis]|nr:bifunctional nuclease domain-containing protein [Ignicoccus hospitalis]HIH90261.1 bifunctional nuclease family protein [Desulfurococcaceae archaeon]